MKAKGVAVPPGDHPALGPVVTNREFYHTGASAHQPMTERERLVHVSQQHDTRFCHLLYTHSRQMGAINHYDLPPTRSQDARHKKAKVGYLTHTPGIAVTLTHPPPLLSLTQGAQPSRAEAVARLKATKRAVRAEAKQRRRLEAKIQDLKALAKQLDKEAASAQPSVIQLSDTTLIG